MQFTSHYSSPLGEILLAADEEGLTGLWFAGQKYFARTLSARREEKRTQILAEAAQWLDTYFSGKDPGPFAPLHLIGTDFQRSVWRVLLTIPYGETMTYGAIAAELRQEQGRSRMCAQAVGSAVGRNPVSIIVPCHRVIGADGSLTGYAGGLEKKAALLQLEHARGHRAGMVG